MTVGNGTADYDLDNKLLGLSSCWGRKGQLPSLAFRRGQRVWGQSHPQTIKYDIIKITDICKKEREEK